MHVDITGDVTVITVYSITTYYCLIYYSRIVLHSYNVINYFIVPIRSTYSHKTVFC